MLVVGSRAVRHHFPEFRQPLDWDLVGTAAEFDRLAESVEEVLSPKDLPADVNTKRVFRYGGRFIEGTISDGDPYWEQVTGALEGGARILEPLLGELKIADPSYVMLTKYCSLAYPLYFWHKGVEDYYFLRDRIPAMPPHVAALARPTLDHAKRMYKEVHVGMTHRTCHPSCGLAQGYALHRRLHEQLALRGAAGPWADEPGAWQGFLEAPEAERADRVRQLFAEEVMVVAAEDLIASGRELAAAEFEFTTRSLRSLATGTLPVTLRYLFINHLREVRALIPDGWSQQLLAFEVPSLPVEVLGLPLLEPPAGPLVMAASAAERQPASPGVAHPCGTPRPVCAPLPLMTP